MRPSRKAALTVTAFLLVAASARAETFLVTAYQANVRERPARTSPVLLTLDRGAVLEVSGRAGRWYRVRVTPSGTEGYVHESLIGRVKDSRFLTPRAAPTPIEPVMPEPRPQPAATPRPPPRPEEFNPPPQPLPPTPLPPAEGEDDEAPRFTITAEGGYQDLTRARQSARALFDGARGGAVFGTSVRYAFTRRLFVAAGARFFQKEGERVFLVDAQSPVVRLGVPFKLQVIPVYWLLGFRFSTGSRIVPYLAVGGGLTWLQEETRIGPETETVSRRKATGIAAGGVDFFVGAFTLGFETSWATVPNSLGTGGVSAVYGEKDVGGLSVVVKVGYAR